jgi:hypothetical protein
LKRAGSFSSRAFKVTLMPGLYNVYQKNERRENMKVFAADIAANMVVVLAIVAAFATFWH